MPGPNLTYDEAVARGALLHVDAYRVELDLSRPGEVFGSTTVIRFTAARPGAATFADLVAPRVREVVLNGRRLDPATVYRDSRIELDDLAAENELRVVADCAYMNTGEGLHRTIDPADGRTYLYTYYEVPDARRVFASFEQPDLKAEFTFTVIAPAHWTVLSNSATPKPEPLSDLDGVSVWRFAPTPRISTYVTALVAGEYHMIHDTYVAPTGQVVPLGLACRASLAPYLDAGELFEITRAGFDYYLSVFDHPYPFEKYDQAFVPEFNIGGMENVGCVTYVERYVFRSKVTGAARERRAEVMLHELAHMWFGNLVTMRWWDDLWLKESLASYLAVRCQAEATRWTNAWTTFAAAEKARGLRQDQAPSTHPIVAEIKDLADIQLNFDGITYAKGAAVVKQLVAWVGSDAFFAGLRTYLRRHAWGSTTLEDLLDVLAEASGRDLASWSRQWLRSPGPNTLRPEYTVDGEGRFTSFVVGQEALAAHPTLRSHRIAIGLYGRSAGALVRHRRLELDVAGARTEVPELVGVTRPEVVLLNDDDLTFASLRLDPRTLAAVAGNVAAFTESLPRALIWTAAWDMVQAQELAPRAYVRMVLAGIAGEDDITMVQGLHAALVTALERYVDPVHLPAVRSEVTTAARAVLAGAPAGSDHQLAWVRLLARVAEAEEDLSLLARLHRRELELPGLVVDTELSWALLTGLVRAGWATAAQIEVELAGDQTTAGRAYALGAHAAQPSVEAKAEAWARVVDHDDLPNKTQEAIVGGVTAQFGLGFVQFGQSDLLAPYVERYFAALPEIWRTRTLEIARILVTGLYPLYCIAPATLARTDEFLADARLPAGLRRLVLEARDELEHSLRARAADRAATDDRTGG